MSLIFKRLFFILVLFLYATSAVWAKGVSIDPRLGKLEGFWQDAQKHMEKKNSEAVRKDLQKLSRYLTDEHDSARWRSRKLLTQTIRKLNRTERRFNQVSARKRHDVEGLFNEANRALQMKLDREGSPTP